MPVDPRVIAARVAGISHGFLAFDDTGSEWTRKGETFKFRLFPNRFVYSREQNRASAPYFTIELGARGSPATRAPSGLRVEPGTALLPAGEALVSWVTPARRRSGRHARILRDARRHAAAARADPARRRSGARVEMHLHDLKISTQSEPQAVGASRRRGGQPRAGSDGNDPRLDSSSRPPARAQAGCGADRPLIGVLPRIGGADVAIIDELDKVNPVDAAS